MSAKIDGQTKFWTGFQEHPGSDIIFDMLVYKQMNSSKLFQAKILKDQPGGIILNQNQASLLNIAIPPDLVQKHAKDETFELKYVDEVDTLLNKIFISLPVFASNLKLYNHECNSVPVTITKKSSSSQHEVILGKDFLAQIVAGYGGEGLHGIVDTSFPNHSDLQLLIFTATYLREWPDKLTLPFYEKIKQKLQPKFKTDASKNIKIEEKKSSPLPSIQEETTVIEYIPIFRESIKREIFTSNSTRILSSSYNLLEKSLTKSMHFGKMPGQQVEALESLVQSKKSKIEDLNDLSNFNITSIKFIPTYLKTKLLITVSMNITQLNLRVLPLVIKATLSTNDGKIVTESCSVVSFDETRTGDLIHKWTFATDNSLETFWVNLQLCLFNYDELILLAELGSIQINLKKPFY